MNNENPVYIIIIAIALALVLVIKPEFIVLNEKHRTESLMKSLRLIGMAVAIVLIAWSVSALIL